LGDNLLLSLKTITRSREPKFEHYVGEFATTSIEHILVSANCDYGFFDMERSGLSIETLKRAVR